MWEKERAMDKLGGGGLIVVAIILVIVGALLQGFIADLVEVLVRIVGLIFIVAGIVIGVMGVIRLFTGDKSGASDF